MPELSEEEASEPLDVQRYLDVARRRYPYILTAFFLGWVVVWGASWVLPPEYKSGTLILVEEPTMPKDYVTPNISDDLQSRLQSITEQILSRTRLLHIIDEFSLYAGGRRELTPDEKVAKMRKDIEINLVRDTPGSGINAFNVYYSARDPHIAQKVTRELTNLFIHENLEVREQQSEDTTKFLEDQLNNARQGLAEQDAKIRQFKAGHIGDLPSQQATNLQILSGLQSQLENEGEALNTAQQQRVYLQTLINQYRALQNTPATADGSPSTLPAIEKQLSDLRTQLAELSGQYTDQYPDIKNLKIEIARTEKMRDQIVAAMKNKSNDDSTPSNSSPAQHETTADLAQNSQLLQLQGQLHANQAEIKNREETMASLKARINEYQARLNEEPTSEEQLADLTRDYDQSQANYDDLLKKENESQMATSMEQMQQGERFQMLDPPSLPEKPDFPNRLKFFAFGLAAGLGLSLAVTGGLEFFDDRLHSEKALKDLLPMKVISEVPEILSAADERRGKRKVVLGWVAAVLVVVILLASSVISYQFS